MTRGKQIGYEKPMIVAIEPKKAATIFGIREVHLDYYRRKGGYGKFIATAREDTVRLYGLIYAHQPDVADVAHPGITEILEVLREVSGLVIGCGYLRISLLRKEIVVSDADYDFGDDSSGSYGNVPRSLLIGCFDQSEYRLIFNAYPSPISKAKKITSDMEKPDQIVEWYQSRGIDVVRESDRSI